MKLRYVMILSLSILFYAAQTCHASWLIYHKPEFKGRVVDIDTGQPIEGAVVIAFYQKETFSPPIEPRTSTIHAKEALTDKNGYFRISSYSTLIQPFSWSGDVMFMIFKPGYLCFGRTVMDGEFEGKGTKDSPLLFETWNKALKYKFTASGTVMLPKITNDKDREESFGMFSFDKSPKLPVAGKMYADEYRYMKKIWGK